ncbi:hypothetical protein Tco_0922782 [Tanacetum coccineum]|uniref:Uncharacterized protein n=1 Tax=Tanacetum coccineum TaxID=301880 RepID=A0ABQ5D047_9ASTR
MRLSIVTSCMIQYLRRSNLTLTIVISPDVPVMRWESRGSDICGLQRWVYRDTGHCYVGVGLITVVDHLSDRGQVTAVFGISEFCGGLWGYFRFCVVYVVRHGGIGLVGFVKLLYWRIDM